MIVSHEVYDELYIESAMREIGLTRSQAIAYMMERKYSQLNHRQAMAVVIRQSWLWKP